MKVTEMAGPPTEEGMLVRVAWRALKRCEHYDHRADECQACKAPSSRYGFAREDFGAFTGWRGPFCSVRCYREWEEGQ